MFALVTTKLKSLSKRTILFYLLTLVTMVGVVFKLLTPNQINPTTNQNYDGSLSRFSSIKFTGRNITIPDQLPTYASVEWRSQELLQNQLLNSFSVEVDEVEPTIWRNEDVTITKIADPTRFIILDNNIRFTKSQPNNNPIPQTNYGVVVEEWVNNHIPESGLSTDVTSIRYLSGGDEAIITTEKLAEIIEIPLAQTINGLPIRSEVGGGYPLYIWYSTKLQKVIKAEFYPILLDFSNPSEMEPIALDEAVSRINSESDARIVYAEQAQEQPFVLDRIKRGELTKATIEYRLKPNQQLMPFYRFDGVFVDQNDIQIFAEVVVPAI
jgi:hypothetical protein